MSTSSNPDDTDSISSLEQSPVNKTDIAEPKATQCKPTVTESEFANSDCTESTAAEFIVSIQLYYRPYVWATEI